MHASVGSGHRSAARSVQRAFEKLIAEGELPKDVRIEFLDILELGRIKFDGNNTASLFIGPTRPIYDLTWRYTFTGRLLWGGGTVWGRLMFPGLTEHVRKVKPIAVVATHITAANAAVSARMITGQDFPIISVPTDYETEGLWPHMATDLFCLATESMAETLRARKVSEERMMVTGIPVREGFARAGEAAADRAEWGLPEDKRVVLVLAGATIPKPYQHFRSIMDQALPFMHRLSHTHFVFIAGKDAEYKAHLEAEIAALGLDCITVLDYVDDMAGLMSACDLAICKSGGLVVTECVCARLPMVLLGRAYGQERVNVRMLTAAGAAMHATTAPELVSALEHLESNPQAAEALLINGSFLRRPNAATDIARAAYKLSQVPYVATDKRRKKHFVRFYWGHKPAHVR
ncbi:MAG: UDP-N-acetylglucosamine 2-epimerase [Coriobacteriia bacterium]|nr:UDP-N-acetylglucosamine 2-epimerase [Coriobacteriia bacterium]